MANLLRKGVRRLTGVDELPVDGETGAWAISLAAHLGLLLSLFSLTLLLPSSNQLILTATPPVDEEIPPEEFRFSDEIQDEIGALADAGADDAAASAELESLESEVILDIQPVVNTGNVQAFELQTPVIEAPQFTNNLLVKGVGAVGTTGAEGAVDRITNEILLSLDQRPTLVVWLFDQSLSLRPQREQIARRFDRVYEELGLVRSGGSEKFKTTGSGGPPLLTAVASFGERLTLVTDKPTDDLEAIKSAVRAVEDDSAGREYVFTAVDELVDKFRYYRLRQPGRNVMFVVFTDEAGDDLHRLDDVVAKCRKLQTPVYVIGSPAPFGRNDAYVKYV
ncbi:MAG: vWA domain-containing protein, partial [Planctomycetota bacterium]